MRTTPPGPPKGAQCAACGATKNLGQNCAHPNCPHRAPAAGSFERYEQALRVIGLPAHVPSGFDPLNWWKHTASKRGEIARDALGVTAEELIRDSWTEAVNAD